MAEKLIVCECGAHLVIQGCVVYTVCRCGKHIEAAPKEDNTNPSKAWKN